MTVNLVINEPTEQKESMSSQSGQLQQCPVSVVSSSSSSSSSVPNTIEKSNKAFLEAISASLGGGITYYVPTVQRNPELTPAQREIITNTFKLCRGLPQGNDQATLSEVRSHFNTMIHTFNLLNELGKNGNFQLYNRDDFDLKYRLAQSYTHLGSFDTAITLLDEIISEIAQSECKLSGDDWDQQYLTFWNLAISLRASIIASPFELLRKHELPLSSPKMKRKFLIDSGAEFRRIGKDEIAAIYYETVLASRKVDRLTRNSLQGFLIDYYRENAPLCMKTEPEKAIKMYEKLIKLEPSQEIFKILFDCYGEQKAKVASNDLIATRIDLLKKIVDLVSSYGDQQSKENLPKLRNELFHSYFVYGKDCFKNNRFEAAIAAFEQALERVERENCLIDLKTLRDLKIELFKAFVAWSSLLENQGLTTSASSTLKEALDFQKVHRLDIESDQMDALFKRIQELAKKESSARENLSQELWINDRGSNSDFLSTYLHSYK